jgi:hypothetical protein
MIGLALVWKIKNPTHKLSIAMNMLAKKAVQKPDTLKPGTIDETRSIISALITSKKSPKVSTVSGIVSQMTTGLMMALDNPSKSAATSKDCFVENEIPWNMKLAIHSDNAVMPQCMKNSMMLSMV